MKLRWRIDASGADLQTLLDNIFHSEQRLFWQDTMIDCDRYLNKEQSKSIFFLIFILPLFICFKK